MPKRKGYIQGAEFVSCHFLLSESTVISLLAIQGQSAASEQKMALSETNFTPLPKC